MAKVLVVDDEPAWLDLARHKLTALGHEVQTVDDCREVLSLLKGQRPDLVVLDLRMPINGRTMLHALQEDWPSIPVVLHTVYGACRDDRDLKTVAAFATKDPELNELQTAVGRVLAGGEHGRNSDGEQDPGS